MKNVFVQVGVITATLLLSSTALGAERPIGDYDPSSKIYPEEGNLKNQNACPPDTKFFKNVAPGLTNGSSEGPTTASLDFSIDGEIVTMAITWLPNNSFGFTLTGGVAHIVGVTSDTNNLLYDYVNFYDPDNQVVGDFSNTPVFEDSGLNTIPDAADVNHLDLCLAVVDIDGPVITFDFPTEQDPPQQVLGTITVEVTVTDPSGVNPDSVTFSVNGGTPVAMDECTLVSGNEWKCTYEWNTSSLSPGLYEISVSATDTAFPVVNTATVSVDVEVIESLADCFGLLGPEDFSGGGDPVTGYTGCEPTPLANIQAPPDTINCNPLLQPPGYILPTYCSISGLQLKPDARFTSTDPAERASIIAEIIALYGSCDACVDPDYCGEYGLPDPRMECVRGLDGGCTDEWYPKTSLQPLFVTDVAEGDTELVLGKYVYGHNGCFAASQHLRGGTLNELYPTWPAEPPTGLVFIKTHSPKDVIPDHLVALCSDIGQLTVSQAGYLPIGKDQSVDRLADGAPAITLAATQECFNPPRTLTRDNGIDVSNIIETDGSDDPVAFKYQMAQMQFDALFTALDCAEPTFLRRGKSRFSNVSSPINQARAQFDNGTIAALERAREDLLIAADAIRTSNWQVLPDNCAGDALARTENLAWRMTDLIAAQSP